MLALVERQHARKNLIDRNAFNHGHELDALFLLGREPQIEPRRTGTFLAHSRRDDLWLSHVTLRFLGRWNVVETGFAPHALQLFHCSTGAHLRSVRLPGAALARRLISPVTLLRSASISASASWFNFANFVSVIAWPRFCASRYAMRSNIPPARTSYPASST